MRRNARPSTSRSAKRKELTIRLSAAELAAIEAEATADHLAISTWARHVVLKRVDEAVRERERLEERRRAGRELAAMLRDLPDDGAHAAEVERARTRGWKR